MVAFSIIELLGILLSFAVIAYITYGLVGTLRLGKRIGTYKNWLVKLYPFLCLPFFVLAWEYLDILPKLLLISLQTIISIGQYFDGNFYEEGLRFNCFYLKYEDIDTIHMDKKKLIITTKSKKNRKSKRYVQRISKDNLEEIKIILKTLIK